MSLQSAQTIGISPAELKRFQSQLKKVSEKKTIKLKQVVENSTKRILADAKRNVPRYTSDLATSLRDIYSVNKLSARVWTNKFYAPYVEFGTKSRVQIPPEIAQYASQFKGKGGGSFDELLKQIRLWCKRKGIDEKAAYPIALELAKKGRKATPFLYPAFKAEEQKFIARIKKVMQENENT